MKSVSPHALRLVITASVLFLFSAFQPVAAQTGVLISGSAGTAVPSAMLEVRSSTKGLLLPNVTLGTLTDATSPVNGPAAGLIVYNTGGANPVGLYYWNGGTNAWVQLTTGGFSGAGVVNYVTRWTSATTLGTGVIYDNGTSVGIGTTSPTASAVLDVTSTTKGFMPPRMTTAQRTAIVSPAEGLMIYNTDTKCLNFYTGSNWGSACAGVSATGGNTVADLGGYRIHTYTSSGSFTVTNPGTVEVLVVAGGGGTGFSQYHNGGGGGGGVVYNANKFMTIGTYTVTVGAGGTGGTFQGQSGTNGQNSVFSDITANGGGYGGTYSNTPGNVGGSGGGGAENGNPPSNVAGTSNQGASGGGTGYGFAGGVGQVGGPGGGGGGGAGGPGGTGITSRGGLGGIGYNSSISGVSAYYGGGGGGCAYYGNATSAGGLGGGGTGWPSTTNGAAGSANGTPNTGGGAGGYERADARAGGVGGSGIVIVRYRF